MFCVIYQANGIYQAAFFTSEEGKSPEKKCDQLYSQLSGYKRVKVVEF